MWIASNFIVKKGETVQHRCQQAVPFCHSWPGLDFCVSMLACQKVLAFPPKKSSVDYWRRLEYHATVISASRRGRPYRPSHFTRGLSVFSVKPAIGQASTNVTVLPMWVCQQLTRSSCHTVQQADKHSRHADGVAPFIDAELIAPPPNERHDRWCRYWHRYWRLHYFLVTSRGRQLCSLDHTLLVRKKQDTLLMSITSRKTDRYSKFFHW